MIDYHGYVKSRLILYEVICSGLDCLNLGGITGLISGNF